MKKIRFGFIGLAMFLVVGLLSSLFANEYRLDENTGLLFDSRGLPLDLGISETVFQDSDVKTGGLTKKKGFLVEGRKIYFITGSEAVIKYYTDNKDAVLEKYKWSKDQSFLKERYNSIYVDKSIPEPSFDIAKILSENYNENYSNGIVNAYTFYGYVNNDIVPVVTFVKVTNEESMKERFELISKQKGYNLSFEDLFLLQ